MGKDLKIYISHIESLLKTKKGGFNWGALLVSHRTRIGFFQHERLIHLLVTLFFGSVFIALSFAYLISDLKVLAALAVLVLGLLICYIWHYFCLENGVQELYKLDEEIEKRA